MKRYHVTCMILAASVLSLAGCSAGPTAPSLPGPAAPGTYSQGSAAPSALHHASTEDENTSPQVLVGSRGGTFTAGRFTVTFPPGAVSGTVTVNLVQPDLAVLRADLSVLPAVATFLQPVTVSANCNGLVNPGRMKHSFLTQLDRTTQNWQPLADSQVDLVTGYTVGTSSACTSYKVDNHKNLQGTGRDQSPRR